MKKFISAALIFALLFTLCACSAKKTGDTKELSAEECYLRDAKIYTKHLLGGALDEYIEYMGTNETDNLEIQSCLFDFNQDKSYELLLTVTGELGIRGPLTSTVFLAIKDEKVEVISEAAYSGGSMGGDSLELVYDTEASEHVLLYFSIGRDGSYYQSATRKICTYDGSEMVTLKTFDILSVDGESEYTSYEKEANEIKQKTDLYTQDGVYVRCYEIDGEYVSEQDYNKNLDIYVAPEDEDYKMKPGTYDNPLNLSEEDLAEIFPPQKSEHSEQSQVEQGSTASNNTKTYYPSDFIGLTLNQIKAILGDSYETDSLGSGIYDLQFPQVPFSFEFGTSDWSIDTHLIDGNKSIFDNEPLDRVVVKTEQEIKLFPDQTYTNRETLTSLKPKNPAIDPPIEGLYGLTVYVNVGAVMATYIWDISDNPDTDLPYLVYVNKF